MINLDGQRFGPANTGYWWFDTDFGGNNMQLEGFADIQSLQLDHRGFGSGITFANGNTSITNTQATFAGNVAVGCTLTIGCTYVTDGYAYFNGIAQVGCSLQIGGTTLTEAQLTALLQLIN